MSSAWIYWSILTIVCFGLWGVFSKVAVDSLGWKSTTILYILGYVWVIPVLFFIYRPAIPLHSPASNLAIISAILAGTLAIVASIGFNIALTSAEASIVVPLTSLYPVITIVISILFLHEKLKLTQGIGMILAIVAIILLSL